MRAQHLLLLHRPFEASLSDRLRLNVLEAEAKLAPLAAHHGIFATFLHRAHALEIPPVLDLHPLPVVLEVLPFEPTLLASADLVVILQVLAVGVAEGGAAVDTLSRGRLPAGPTQKAGLVATERIGLEDRDLASAPEGSDGGHCRTATVIVGA